MMKDVRKQRVLMGRLKHGADLLDEITRLCEAEDIRLGRVQALGAVQKARIGFYNQRTREYEYLAFDRPMEIAALVGNISIKDGAPMVHAHVTLSDSEGKAYGGHLARGTVVFSCECILEACEGPVFEREYDAQTGLTLWPETDKRPANR